MDKALDKEELIRKRKEHINQGALCSTCNKKLGFEITPEGKPICIPCLIELKGDLTPEQEKRISINTKGIPKIFAYYAFVRDYFKCKKCGIRLLQNMARPLRLSGTENKPLQLKYIITVCPDCARYNRINLSSVNIPTDILVVLKEQLLKPEEKIISLVDNALTKKGAALKDIKGDARIYELKPYTFFVDISKEPTLINVIRNDTKPKQKNKKRKMIKAKINKNLPEIIVQAHAKFNGICQKCGQHMDKNVVRLRRYNKDLVGSIDNVMLLCPDCKEGKENPALKGMEVSNGAVKKLVDLLGMDLNAAREKLSHYPRSYALVSIQGPKRVYWCWDKNDPVIQVYVNNNRVTGMKINNRFNKAVRGMVVNEKNNPLVEARVVSP